MRRTWERGTGNRRLYVPPRHLTVFCWCMREVVVASECDIINGKTASCGKPDCHGPCEVSR